MKHASAVLITGIRDGGVSAHSLLALVMTIDHESLSRQSRGAALGIQSDNKKKQHRYFRGTLVSSKPRARPSSRGLRRA